MREDMVARGDGHRLQPVLVGECCDHGAFQTAGLDVVVDAVHAFAAAARGG